jgi:hypothetical protein
MTAAASTSGSTGRFRRTNGQSPFVLKSVAASGAGGGGLGLAAICSGGGQGDALLVEV